jgi:ubiquinone/menaquinone biosynthesis C-methylase UbiE
MTAIEKYFVNSPGHTRTVDSHALQLLARIDYQSGWRYLDVGCGIGTAARQIAATTDMSVTAVDVDPKQIAIAKSAAPGSRVDYRVMDATKLEFADGQFNVTAAQMATHHIPHWERAFAEMVRVLRYGGYLIYRDFAFPWWLAKVVRRLPSTRAIDQLARDAGLVRIYASRQYGKQDSIWLKPDRVG